MWIVQIQEHYLIFKTMKDIKREFPFLDKDRIYNLRKRNRNKWMKNKRIISKMKIHKL